MAGKAIGSGRKLPLTRRSKLKCVDSIKNFLDLLDQKEEKYEVFKKKRLGATRAANNGRSPLPQEIEGCDKLLEFVKHADNLELENNRKIVFKNEGELRQNEDHDYPDMAITRRDPDVSFQSSDSDSETQPQHQAQEPVLDTPDYNPSQLSFTCFDIIIYIMSIGTYLADVGTDIWVALLYYNRGHWWWCGLTLSFVFIPSLVMGAFSLRWYLIDHRSEMKISWPRWIFRIFFIVFQIAPILRYIDIILFGWMTKKASQKEKKQMWFYQMLYEDVDSTLLRLFEAFMEAAPQLVMQLYIMQRSVGETDPVMVTVQTVSLAASLGSLSWALAAYHRSLRCSLDNKTNITYCGTALQFLWRVFTIGARVGALALFASLTTYGVFIIAGVHWIIMLIWIRLQESNFCLHRWEEVLFNAVAAIIHIFCFFNLVEGHTRLKYLFYYTLVYMENAGMVLAWYLLTQTEQLWYRYPAICVVLGGFFIGIMFQAIYYLKFHPNNSDPKHQSIKWWVPCNQLSCTSAIKHSRTDEEITTHVPHTKSNGKKKDTEVVVSVDRPHYDTHIQMTTLNTSPNKTIDKEHYV